ncbi:hypothetical protein [Bdellovibrio bacteriovorus]|uniref:Lipoprotein n=1 Tax=Bdellovibrio bacteriovorus TaxID=959 RepID=A0A150WGP9_BDEBC|nr:hypothetical protein [Bdellovibrio bacteriovorus]KYG62123.1 hypothetical protein AZI85_07965 [Bdellovibrio bacteriovorus]
MKKLVYFVFALFLAACQPGDDGGAGTTTVVTPLNTGCLTGQAYCNNTVYSQYYGFIPYPGMYNYAYNYTNYFNQYGFCGCPAGYSATYNGSFGLGCIHNDLINPYYNTLYYWQWGYTWGYTTAAPQTTINIPQISNVPGASNSASACRNKLTQSCLLDQGNTCGAGATCRQVIYGSNLGVCTY